MEKVWKLKEAKSWFDKNEIISNNPASVDYGKPINPKYLATLVDSNTVYFAMWCMKTWNKQDMFHANFSFHSCHKALV